MSDDNTYWWDGDPCVFCGSYRCDGDCPEAYEAMVDEMIEERLDESEDEALRDDDEEAA